MRHYKMVLTTVGPVHIGNGESYGKKDYFVVDNNNVAVLDVPRFVAGLKADELEQYCSFLQSDSRSSLQDYLKDRPNLMVHARKCVAYQAEMTLSKARRGTWQFFEVAQCIKDVDGCPIVPGSSVKGMLRTAILTHLILNDCASYAPLYNRADVTDKYERKRACRDIERKAFWRERPSRHDENEAYDIMRYVSVSDSVSLSTNDLVFVKKYDKFARSDFGSHKLAMGKISREKSYYEGNALNIYHECIKPGTRVECVLDVDDRIDAYLSGLVLDADGISAVLEELFDLYASCFLDRFDLEDVGGADGGKDDIDDGRCRFVYASGPSSRGRCRNKAVGNTGYCNMHKEHAVSAGKKITCYLGGGVGFNSKTVVNALLKDDSSRVYDISRILYAQSPTELDPKIHHELEKGVREAGFRPKYKKALRFRGRLKKGKDDHRHWKDAELGVSPHTVKLGIIGTKKYLMGKCMFELEEDR